MRIHERHAYLKTAKALTLFLDVLENKDSANGADAIKRPPMMYSQPLIISGCVTRLALPIHVACLVSCPEIKVL